MAERIDEIGFGGYRLIQDTDAFCYGTDAVLLADMEINIIQQSIATKGYGQIVYANHWYLPPLLPLPQ